MPRKIKIGGTEIDVGSVKNIKGATIISLAECMCCASHETKRCPTFSNDLCDAFVCKKCCEKCKRYQKCDKPAW